jgi:glycerol-3-phosphate dehydrogenase
MFPVKRDLGRLSRQTYDILIVGGGIYGCVLAREAARRGLSVAVVDKGDFCSATSANSLKIIHGGIRYLQQFDLLRLRQSARERRILLQIAPHLVHPLRCAMPTFGHLLKSREALFCGMLANDILSWDRNRGLPPDKRISMGRTGSRAEWLHVAPDIDDPRYTGVAFWQDAYAYNTERLGIGFLKAAVRAGADAANYLEVAGFRRKGRDVTGATAVDRVTGKTVAIAATVTVLNTGPWTKHTLSLLGDKVSCPDFRLSLTMNIVLRRQLTSAYALGLPLYREGWKKSRLYFFVPWRGRTMIGTHMRIHEGSPDTMSVTAQDLNSFISILNQAHPGARIAPEDVSFVHAGLLPAEDRDVGPGEEPEPLPHFRIVDHAASDGLNGLLTVLGVKYTTARDVAARTLTKLEARLGPSIAPASRSMEPLPGGDFRDLGALVAEAEAAGFSPDTARHLIYNYGAEYRDVVRLGTADRALLDPIGEGVMVLGAEVVHAIREEMAVTLADVVLRRTDLASAGLPNDAPLERAAELMAGELGWDEPRIRREIEGIDLRRP